MTEYLIDRVVFEKNYKNIFAGSVFHREHSKDVVVFKCTAPKIERELMEILKIENIEITCKK